MVKATKEFQKSVETLVALSLLEEKPLYQSKLEPFEAYAARVFDQTVQQYMSSLDCLLKGYQIILNKLPEEKKVVFSIDDNLAPSLKDNNAFEAAIEEKGSLQALIGYSDEMCCTIFDIVDQLKNERQFEDGSNALLFLMMLKPFVSGCWIILGELWTEMHRIDDALYAYLVAINCAPFELEPYQYAIRFCLANNHKPEALRILDYGLEFTASHELCSEEEKALPEQLRLIKAYVESVK